MNRAALEHIVRAAAMISGDDELIVIGSQAILGQYPDAPAALLMSDEADVYPRNHPERAELIERVWSRSSRPCRPAGPNVLSSFATRTPAAPPRSAWRRTTW
ncbi:MAG: hypothetical protein KA297_10845 [Kofleriaceae bacterium]|nr:hypothetical protein [Kofleriaceae bacterium]MBP6838389.1 hypothetical protein [Kofleriaceae bacterium]